MMYKCWKGFLLVVSVVTTLVQASKDTSFLMIGNSFTDANNLQEMIQSMLKQDPAYGGEIYGLRFREPASRWADDVKKTTLQSTIAERSWNWVVLQEQSQIPAFWGTRFQYDFDLSVNAVKQFDSMIEAANSETILMMTWGRRTNDWAWYPDMFPDFLTMQEKVTAGYLTYQNVTSSPERPVRIAPAGLAFEHIFKSIPGNASEDGTDFTKLYMPDGTHPSVQGTFLIALVVYSTMTGHDPRDLDILGPPNISRQRQQALKEVAWTVVSKFNEENEWNRKFFAIHPTDNQIPGGSGTTNDKGSSGTSSSSGGSSFFAWCLLLIVVGGVWYIRQKHHSTVSTTSSSSERYYHSSGVGGGLAGQPYKDLSSNAMELITRPTTYQ